MGRPSDGGRNAARRRCPGAVRRHRRSRQAQAVPGALPPRTPRHVEGAGDRRGPQRLDRPGVLRQRPRLDHRRDPRCQGRRDRFVDGPARPHPGRLLRSQDVGRRCTTPSIEHKSKVAVFYMAIPPTMFPTVAQSLASVGLNERGRIVVEKPFGRDLASAMELNATLHTVFPEERIFRIDHYLGKESVEDLLVFRFSNTLLEPVWNRNYVRSVQITMSETIGVEGRGSFYDGVGAIRDVMQNHLLQVTALAAMEPPVGPDTSYLQDEKAKVFAAMRPIDPAAAGARSVRRLPRRARCRARLDRRDVRRRPPGDRFVAVGGRAVVRALRQGSQGRRHRGGRRVPRATEPAVRRGRRADAIAQPGALPARQPGRRHLHAAGQDARARTSTARTSTWPSTSPPRSANAARPTSACSTTPWPGRRAASPAKTSSS